MSQKRVPVPRRFVAVEGRASGDAPFDGNYTDSVLSWFFTNELWHTDGVPIMIQQLMDITEAGHLAWVVFPPEGYRL